MDDRPIKFLLCSSEADTPLDTSLLQYAGKCSHIQTVDMAGAEVTGQTMGATWQTERLQPVLYDANKSSSNLFAGTAACGCEDFRQGERFAQL